MNELDAPTVEPEQLFDVRRFDGLGDVELGDLARLLSISKERRLPVGTRLAERGSPLMAAWFVREGTLHVTGEGADYRVHLRENVGMLEMIGAWPDGLEVVCVSDAVVLQIERDDLLVLLGDYFEALVAVMRSFSGAILALSPLETSPHLAQQPGPRSPLSFVDRLLFLHELAAFEEAGVSSSAELALATPETSAGGTLVQAGEQIEHLHAVVHGRLRYGELEVPAGGAFGGLHAVAEAPLAHDLVAEPGTILMSFGMQRVFDMLEDDLPLAFAWLRGIARRLRELSPQRIDKSAMS